MHNNVTECGKGHNSFFVIGEHVETLDVVPLAAIFCIACHFTLDGLVAAGVIGYSTTGLVLAYVLLRSDWKHISKTIREYQKEEEGLSMSSRSSDGSKENNHLKNKDIILGQMMMI